MLFLGGRRAADDGGAVAALEVDGEGVEIVGDDIAVVAVDAVDGTGVSEEDMVGIVGPSRSKTRRMAGN